MSGQSESKVSAQGAATGSPQSARPKIRRRVPVVRALVQGGGWSRADALIAIGLTIAIAAIVAPLVASSFQSNPPSPDLIVDDVQIALARNIDASSLAPGMATPSPQAGKVSDSAIDITLRNSGDQPALIVKAVLSFVRATELDNCPGGAGAAVSTAEYDVKVPTTKPVDARHPLVLRRDMRFVVNANSIDRFRISVGPRQYSDVDWPWIYQFNLSLVEDNGQHVDLGPMSVLGFDGFTGSPLPWDPLRSFTPTQAVINLWLPCIIRDAAQLSHATASPGLPSPELQMMYHEAELMIAHAPSCRKIPIAQNPNGCPGPGGSGFFSNPSGLIICSDTLEVLVGFPCGEGADIATQYEAQAKAPAIAQLIFTIVGKPPLPMECLPEGRAEVCRGIGIDGQGLVVGFIP